MTIISNTDKIYSANKLVKKIYLGTNLIYQFENGILSDGELNDLYLTRKMQDGNYKTLKVGQKFYKSPVSQIQFKVMAQDKPNDNYVALTNPNDYSLKLMVWETKNYEGLQKNWCTLKEGTNKAEHPYMSDGDTYKDYYATAYLNYNEEGFTLRISCPYKENHDPFSMSLEVSCGNQSKIYYFSNDQESVFYQDLYYIE